jgi:hypothetical protein
MKIIMSILLFIPFVSFSQGVSDSTYPYSPDRPGFSYSPYIVGLNQFGLECGVGYSSNFYYSTSTIRYGIGKHLEVFTEFDYGFTLDSNKYRGIDALIIGLKVPIIYNKKYFPDIALLGSFSTNFRTVLDLLVQKNIKKLSLIFNVGSVWDTTNVHVQGMYVFVVSYYLTKKISTYIETYGYYNDILSGGDIGFGYDISSELTLDISAGVMYSQWFKNDYFVGCGISWRIPKYKKHENIRIDRKTTQRVGQNKD